MNDVIKNYPRGIPAIGMKPTDVVDVQMLNCGIMTRLVVFGLNINCSIK